jgi:hypothetical protein
MKYRIFVPIHIATQNVLAEWVGFIAGFFGELGSIIASTLKAIGGFRK